MRDAAGTFGCPRSTESPVQKHLGVPARNLEEIRSEVGVEDFRQLWSDGPCVCPVVEKRDVSILIKKNK